MLRLIVLPALLCACLRPALALEGLVVKQGETVVPRGEDGRYRLAAAPVTLTGPQGLFLAACLDPAGNPALPDGAVIMKMMGTGAAWHAGRDSLMTMPAAFPAPGTEGAAVEALDAPHMGFPEEEVAAAKATAKKLGAVNLELAFTFGYFPIGYGDEPLQTVVLTGFDETPMEEVSGEVCLYVFEKLGQQGMLVRFDRVHLLRLKIGGDL